jgi:hypothetical protein
MEGQVSRRWQKIGHQLDGSQWFIRVDDFLFHKLTFLYANNLRQ